MSESPLSHGAAPPKLGRYQVLLPIGVGGMGSVYAARGEVVTGVNRIYALKLLHPQFRADPTFAHQLLEEARVAATIRHPNVVSVVEAAERDGHVYLVMDYVDGGTLSALLRTAHRDSSPLPLPIIGRIFSDALAGLIAAHTSRADDGTPLGLIHRDFSPQNLLVGTDGITRLTDFGIAKAMRRESVTATGEVKGKIGYMAPEQALGHVLDARCDQWAAGVVLWESLTSQRLLSGDNDATILLKLVSGGPMPPPSLFRKDLPVAIDAILERVLQRDREARFADVASFRDALLKAFEPVGIAEAAEVGQYVERSLGADISKRKAQLAKAAQALSSTSDTKEPGETAAAMPVSGPELPTRSYGSAAAAIAADPPRGVRWKAYALGLSGAIAVAAIAYGSLSGGTETKPQASPRATVPVPPPVVPPAAAISADSAVGPRSLMLQVEANAPMVELQIGDRAPVVLLTPSKSVRLPIELGDAGPMRLIARTRDGRTEEIAVASDQREVSVEFAPAKVGTPRWRPPPKPDDDQLAPTP